MNCKTPSTYPDVFVKAWSNIMLISRRFDGSLNAVGVEGYSVAIITRYYYNLQSPQISNDNMIDAMPICSIDVSANSRTVF